MMCKFKMGDRIKVIKQYGGLPKGNVGKVVKLRDCQAGVEIDNWNNGHTCDIHDGVTNRYWVENTYLELLEIKDWRGEFE